MNESIQKKCKMKHFTHDGKIDTSTLRKGRAKEDTYRMRGTSLI